MKSCDANRFAALITVSVSQAVTGTNTIIKKLGRNKLGVVISVLIFTAAALALYYALRDIDIDKVIGALCVQPRQAIGVASAFVVAGYMTLVLYDVFALRTIGHRAVPLHVAAVASFTSYTIGHALGAATLTGGFVRHRVYSVWGLSVIDVTKMAFVTGMTFCLGNALVLGAALSFAPRAASAIDRLPVWINCGVGIASLFGLLVYLLWLGPQRRVIGISSWRIALPDARSTLLQIAIGATDLCLVTAAMYMLLPEVPAVDFITVLFIFLSATLIGTVSHVPGNLGIMEAGMLLGLPLFEKEELLASLLTFRVLYFAVPLFFAMLALALRELGLLARPRTTS
jgi:glycosyltransferase 2 family protein